MKKLKTMGVVGLMALSLAGHAPVIWAKSTQSEKAQVVKEAGVTNLINVNTADVAALKSVKGLGLSKARAIVAYREKNGSFASVDDLTHVRGISTRMLEKIGDKSS